LIADGYEDFVCRWRATTRPLPTALKNSEMAKPEPVVNKSANALDVVVTWAGLRWNQIRGPIGFRPAVVWRLNFRWHGSKIATDQAPGERPSANPVHLVRGAASQPKKLPRQP